MRELEPVPDPSGALQPPNRYPPTAVGTETPEPEPFPQPGAPRSRSLLGTVLEAALALPVLVIGAVLYPFTNRHRHHRRGRRRG